MNNKPTIIDEINVSECEHFTQEQPQFDITCLFYAFKNKNKCEDSPNCYYKQLQRKIQECEKLKEANQAWGLTVTHLRAELEEEKKTMWITQNNKIWYSEAEYKKLQQALEEIREIAKTGLKPVCYKANCSTCRCYTKDDKNYSLHCLINSYINEDGELMDGNCDFAEALESLIDSERVACNKAKPIADKILNKINEVLK